MESQILIRGFRSVKSSSVIYRILAAVLRVCPTVLGNRALGLWGLSNGGGVTNWAVRVVSLRLAQAHGPSPRDILAHLLVLAGII